MIVYLVVPIICNSCFSDDRFQPDTAIFKSDGSDVNAYMLCTWWSGVVTTKTGFKLPVLVATTPDHHVHSMYT